MPRQIEKNAAHLAVHISSDKYDYKNNISFIYNFTEELKFFRDEIDLSPEAGDRFVPALANARARRARTCKRPLKRTVSQRDRQYMDSRSKSLKP